SFGATLPGGIAVHFSGVSVTGTGCDSATTVAFSGGSVTLRSFLKATGVDGSISSSGITITAGTITGPAAWNAPTFSIKGGGIFLAFPGGSASASASDVEAEGSVSGNHFAFVPLPAGWTGSTTLTFGVANGVKCLSVESDATGPAHDASPDSQAPTMAITGAIASDGTIALDSPSGSLGFGVKLAYDDPKNWSLTADGLGDSEWRPLPGLTLTPKDVHGAITAKDDAYHFSLEVAPAAAWTPTGQLSVADLKLSLSNTCADTGAPCPEKASVFLQLSG